MRFNANLLFLSQYLCLTVCFLNTYRSSEVFAYRIQHIRNNHLSADGTYSLAPAKTNTLNVKWSKYSILDVHSLLSKQNIGCSMGSEIPAMREVVNLEIVVYATSAWKIAKCLLPYVIALRRSQQYFSHDVFLGSICTK